MSVRDRDTRPRVLAFAAGQNAHLSGLSLESNPHPKGSDLHKRWASGWKSSEATSIEHAPRGE